MEKTDKKSKIFIIDDDRFLLDMYSLKFAEEGFDVETSLSSEEALTKLKDKTVQPDVILLDIVMPTIDGFELLKQIRDKKISPDSKIIVLSNLGESVEIEKAGKLDVDGYIVKASFTPSEVVEKVIDVLGNKKK